MQWLAVGPYGNRAGDILLLAKACTQLPVEQRFYFASVSHHTWHGSACEQDSRIPFILAQAGGSGERMRAHAKIRRRNANGTQSDVFGSRLDEVTEYKPRAPTAPSKARSVTSCHRCCKPDCD
jgi:hypothetical protein